MILHAAPPFAPILLLPIRRKSRGGRHVLCVPDLFASAENFHFERGRAVPGSARTGIKPGVGKNPPVQPGEFCPKSIKPEHSQIRFDCVPAL